MTEKESATKKEMFDRLSPCDLDSPYIFVSYSSRDWIRVCTDVYELQRRGCNVWIDAKNLDKTKDSWKKDALGAIRSYCCEFVIFYVSGASLSSEQCLTEIQETFSQETVDYHAGDPVQFICIDAEQIGDIQKARLRIKENIRNDASLSTAEKGRRSRALSVFLREIFKGNNERVRIHPADEPNRQSDYYDEILQSLPAGMRGEDIPEPDGDNSSAGGSQNTAGNTVPPDPEEETPEPRLPREDGTTQSGFIPADSPARAAALQEDLIEKIVPLSTSSLSEQSVEELRNLYEAALKNAEENGLAPAGTARFPILADVCLKLGGTYKKTGRIADADAMYRDGVRLCLTLCESDPVKYNPLLATLYEYSAAFSYSIGKTDEAEEYYVKALRLRRKAAEDNPEKYTLALSNTAAVLAGLYENTGRPDEAEALYREALTVRRTLFARQPDKYRPHMISLLKKLAGFYRRTMRPEAAESLESEADALYGSGQQRKPDPAAALTAPPTVLPVPAEAGEIPSVPEGEKVPDPEEERVEEKTDKNATAENAADENIPVENATDAAVRDNTEAGSADSARYEALQTELLSKIDALTSRPLTKQSTGELRELYEAARTNAVEHGLDLKCCVDYVWFLFRQKEYADGIREAETLYPLLKGRESSFPVSYARVCRVLVQMYDLVGRTDDALSLGSEILPVLRELGGKNQDLFSQNTASLADRLAELYVKANRGDLAEPLYEESLSIWRRIAVRYPNFRQEQAWTAQKLGQLYLERGRYEAAELIYTEALSAARALAADHPANMKYSRELTWACCNLANLCKKTQQYEKAAALYEEALAVRRALAGKDPGKYNAELIWTCGSLAYVYRRLGRSEEANALKAEADSLRGGK